MHPYSQPAEHAAIPLLHAEHWFYEDFEVGRSVRSVRRTIGEGESMQFNVLVHDLHPYQADEVYAREQGIFGQRLVAGNLVFSMGMGLVATPCVNAFSYGFDKLRFIKPVFFGDTLYTVRTNMAKEPRFSELGMVRSACEVFKNGGELVLYCEHLQTVLYRDPVLWQQQAEPSAIEAEPGAQDADEESTPLDEA